MAALRADFLLKLLLVALLPCLVSASTTTKTVKPVK